MLNEFNSFNDLPSPRFSKILWKTDLKQPQENGSLENPTPGFANCVELCFPKPFI